MLDIVDAFKRVTTPQLMVSAFAQAGILYKSPDGMSPFSEELLVSYVDPTRARAVVRRTGLFAGWDPVPRPAREWIRVERLGFIDQRRAELSSSRGRAVDETPGRTSEAGVHLGTQRRQNALTAPVEWSRQLEALPVATTLILAQNGEQHQLSEPADAHSRLPGLAESTTFIQTHNNAPLSFLAPVDAPNAAPMHNSMPPRLPSLAESSTFIQTQYIPPLSLPVPTAAPVMARTQRAALPAHADAATAAPMRRAAQNIAPTLFQVPADAATAARTQRAAQRAALPAPPRLHAQTTDLSSLFISPRPLPSPP